MYDYYGYQGCFVVLGAITLNSCVGGALFRPLMQNQRHMRQVRGPLEGKGCGAYLGPKQNDASENGNCNKMQICSGHACPTDNGASPSRDECDKSCQTQHSLQQWTDSHEVITYAGRLKSICNNKCGDDDARKSGNRNTDSQSRSRHPSRSVENILVAMNDNSSSQLTCTNEFVNSGDSKDMTSCSIKRSWRSENELEIFNNNISPFKGFSTEIVNSLNRLPGSTNSCAYVLLEAAESRCDKDCDVRKKKTRRKLFNWELLKLPSFLVICLLGITANATFAITVNFLPALAVDMGMTRDQGAFLLSMLGIGDMVGRLPVGVLFDLPLVKTHRNMIYGLFMTVNGIMTFVMPLSANYATLGAVCLIRGLSSGVFMSQRATILADMIGISRVANAFGMQLLVMTLGSLAARLTGGGWDDKHTTCPQNSVTFSDIRCMLPDT